jgi:hypothetical protein
MNQQAIRGVLLCRSAGATDAAALAAAAISIWQEMAGRLVPVIGGLGVDVLFRHALHLTGKTFPCLALATNEGSSAKLQAELQACLAASEADVAIAASTALLATFMELLNALIGESLSERLLAPVWVPPRLAAAQENVP